MAKDVKYIDAKRLHYVTWLEQKKSTLADALLVINYVYCTQPGSTSSVGHLKKMIADDKLVPRYERLPVEFRQALDQNPMYSKISKVFSLINENRMNTLTKSDQFAATKEPNFLIHDGPLDSKILMETTVEPHDFVLQLLAYPIMLPEELQIAWTILRRLQVIPQTKPIDPREEKTLYKIIYSIVKKHYKYDPNASKNTDTAKIMTLVHNSGFDISPATVKRILDKAFKIAEEELDQIAKEELRKNKLL